MAHAHHHYDHAPRARRSFYDDSSSDFDDTRSVASSARESFMDLTSPSTPHFSRHDRADADADDHDVCYGGLSVRPRSDTAYSDDSPVVLSPMRFSRPDRIGPAAADADSDGDTETEGEADPRPAPAPAPRGGTRAHIRLDTGHNTAVRPRISFISLSAQLTGPFNSSWLCITGGQHQQQQTRRGPKPPLPEAPKPHFQGRGSTSTPATKRSPSTPGGGCGTPALSLSAASSPAASASASPVRSPDVPPTTNLLNRQERAELVRKTRKLAQVFGQTPSGLAMAMGGGPPRQGSPPARLVLPGHGHRGAVSISGGEGEVGVGGQGSSSSSREGSRRRSMPLSPSEMSTVLSDRWSGVVGGSGRQTDAESFMDLSDEERGTEKAARGRSGRTSRVHGRLSVLSTATTTSGDGLDDMASLMLDPAEEERRRKREKLAKLHRFLGSRVPASLVLGLDDADPDASLPAPQIPLPVPAIPADDPSDTDARAWRRLRRRSSSAAEMKSKWLDPADRVKEDLDDREKAINVRRAIKMEKMFGVPPPQTLYHTRHSPAVTPHSPASSARFSVASDLPSPSLGGVPASPTGRNINQSAYINKGKGRRSSHRPGHSSPSESMQNLLLHDADYTLSGSPSSPSASLTVDHRASSIYMHYRHSLNSLNDIIDRDDKESLAELHQYITNDLASLDPSTTPPHNVLEHPHQHHQSPQPHQHPYTHALAQSEAKALRAERRRSLPVRTSTLSLASQYTLASPEPEMVSFQARRRRAAKLTSFFGVDYRDLVGEILDSIEHGLEEDGSRGSLQPEEMQELLQRLRKLKTKRPGMV